MPDQLLVSYYYCTVPYQFRLRCYVAILGDESVPFKCPQGSYAIL